jgi:dipeptidyl-peptidase-3
MTTNSPSGVWKSVPIIFRQVSPESPEIFALIKELYGYYRGDWNKLLDSGVLGLNESEAKDVVDQFLWYAATFLSNMGNYYGEGDQKFVPDVDAEIMGILCSVTPRAASLFEECGAAMLSSTPKHLGFPSDDAQSAYYTGSGTVTKEDLDAMAHFLSSVEFRSRNTRLLKDWDPETGRNVFEVLIASNEQDTESRDLGELASGKNVVAKKGDHAAELEKVVHSLQKASATTSSDLRKEILSHYTQFFQTGDFTQFDNSQRVWMKDRRPAVKTFFGFNYKYRDPAGARAEFQAFVGIVYGEDSKKLHDLEGNAQRYIKTLPWASSEGDCLRNGPFEMDVFQAPDFNAIHGKTTPHLLIHC